MCEYCNEPTKNIKLHRQRTDTNIVECYIHGLCNGYAIFLRQDLKINITSDLKVKISQLNKLAYIDINFCPFCGRKLSEVSE